MDLKMLTTLNTRELERLVDQIGNTPLQPVYLKISGKTRKVMLKLEKHNPTGSVKDRTAYALIREMECKNVIKRHSVIIESTSGNLGVAMSMICKARHYRLRIVIDPKATRENVDIMAALGAEIELVEQPDEVGGYLLSRLARIKEICHHSDAYVWTNQYMNAANPQIHFTQTGREVYQQMRGTVDAIFVAVSTGGTLAGIARYFRTLSPQTRIIGVDVHGSVVFGTAPGPRKLTGIGSSKPSHFLTRTDYDDYFLVSDEEAFACCRTIADATGIKVGGSSGAVLSACARYLEIHPHTENVVCICADAGEKYASSIFNDAWLHQHHLHLTQDHLGPLQDVAGEAQICLSRSNSW